MVGHSSTRHAMNCHRLSVQNPDEKSLLRDGQNLYAKGQNYVFARKASASNVFCSTSCAFAEPVAGLALAERFTENTGRLRDIRRNLGIT